jgi:hypothetical protein
VILCSWRGLSLCSTVVDAVLAGLVQSVAAGLADRVATAVVFVVGRDVSDRRVQPVLRGSRCGGLRSPEVPGQGNSDSYAASFWSSHSHSTSLGVLYPNAEWSLI